MHSLAYKYGGFSREKNNPILAKSSFPLTRCEAKVIVCMLTLSLEALIGDWIQVFFPNGPILYNFTFHSVI